MTDTPENPQPKPSPAKSEAWSVRGLRLPATDAIAKLRENDKIPDEDRDWLIRKIEKSGFAGVVVDAHEHFHEGATILNASVLKLY